MLLHLGYDECNLLQDIPLVFYERHTRIKENDGWFTDESYYNKHLGYDLVRNK